MNRKFKSFKELEGCVIIYTDNYLNDIEGEELESTCDIFLNKGKKRVIIDFANTELINSIGISILIGIMEKIKEIKGILFFSGLKKINHDIFNVLGLTKYVPIFQTEDEAVKNIMTNNL
ncbi:MAG: STAS domain-containing protein [Deltaproteobacteria bacterium]|jgi:anti-sigma B factor antagonist|nr:STAS domain-containing protein [Deltaproteobacteria bacterium]